MINVGIGEGVQPNIIPGTTIVTQKAIGFDGLLNFYAGRDSVCDLSLEKSFTEHMSWNPIKGSPYVATTEASLILQVAQDDLVRGYTVSCIGYYAPQGRGLRLPLEDKMLKEKLASFEYNGGRICNIDMESASIIGLASLLGHNAISCCIVDDAGQISNLDKNESFKSLIKTVIDRI